MSSTPTVIVPSISVIISLEKMKYLYSIITALSLTVFINVYETETDVQYYDMSEFEITITPDIE